MAEAVYINEVGPRDGLQSQPRVLAPAERVRLVRSLLGAGVGRVEVGAFVSPRAVPAMAGTDQVLAGLLPAPNATLTVLVPNTRGYELALAAGARSVCLVLYGSEGMAQANVRMGRDAAEAEAMGILSRAREDGIRVTATLAVAFECPYDGPVDPVVAVDTANRCLDGGVDEFCLADTIGAANPLQVRSLTQALVDQRGAERLGCHFHDTRAMGLANVFAALESGIRRFDSSIAGLGGCPFAPGASGNVATEDVTMMLDQCGFETGVDLGRLLQAAELAGELTGTAPGGRARPWLKHHYRQVVS